MNCSEREPGYVIELFYCIKDIGFVSTKQNHTRFISLIIVSLLGTMPAILRGSGVVDTVDLWKDERQGCFQSDLNIEHKMLEEMLLNVLYNILMILPPALSV